MWNLDVGCRFPTQGQLQLVIIAGQVDEVVDRTSHDLLLAEDSLVVLKHHVFRQARDHLLEDLSERQVRCLLITKPELVNMSTHLTLYSLRGYCHDSSSVRVLSLNLLDDPLLQTLIVDITHAAFALAGVHQCVTLVKADSARASMTTRRADWLLLRLVSKHLRVVGFEQLDSEQQAAEFERVVLLYPLRGLVSKHLPQV